MTDGDLDEIALREAEQRQRDLVADMFLAVVAARNAAAAEREIAVHRTARRRRE